MRWVWGINQDQLRTHDDQYVVYRQTHAGGKVRYAAWGPHGSQDVSYIQAHTAHVLREALGIERRAEDLKVISGRGLLGVYRSNKAARAACLEHSLNKQEAVAHG